MEIEAVEQIHETMQSARTLGDRVNCPHMEKERRCIRPKEVQRNYCSVESIL